jgi:peptidyl-tRNA hydrolase
VQKVYIVTRRDLRPGLQAAQACHAVTDLILTYPEEAQKWREDSNFLIVLSVENEQELCELAIELARTNMHWCKFREPDMNNELTALAVLPDKYSEKFFRNLPLALRET